jgi:hypothetical protein
MKINQIINNKVIDSFIKIKQLELFVYYNGFTEDGYFTQLLRSNFEIEPSSEKYKISSIYADDYSGSINSLDICEIELNATLHGSLYTEFIQTSLEEFYKDHQVDAFRVYLLFKEKVEENLRKNLPEDISISITIREPVDIFHATKNKNIGIEVKLSYYKKVKRYL